MQELNIKPELEVYDTGHVDAALALAADGLLSAPLQFGIVMGVRGGMAATHENLLSVVRRLPQDAVWQAIAIGCHNFDFAALAMTLGGNARTGLEDNLYLRRGELSPGNAPLVSRLATIAAALDRPLAIVGETEAMLKLAPAGGARTGVDKVFPTAAAAAHDVSSESSRRMVANPTTSMGENQDVYRT